MIQLKEKGWILSLQAGVNDDDGYDCGTFGAKYDIAMKLTTEGLQHWEEIVQTVFDYVAMLQTTGLPAWFFEEVQGLTEISFRFKEDTSAVEQCEDIAQIMQVWCLRCIVKTFADPLR